jgi:hypothetical protein
VRNDSWDKRNTVLLPPHSAKIFFLQIELPDAVTQPEEASFGVFANETYLQELHVPLIELK